MWLRRLDVHLGKDTGCYISKSLCFDCRNERLPENLQVQTTNSRETRLHDVCFTRKEKSLLSFPYCIHGFFQEQLLEANKPLCGQRGAQRLELRLDAWYVSSRRNLFLRTWPPRFKSASPNPSNPQRINFEGKIQVAPSTGDSNTTGRSWVWIPLEPPEAFRFLIKSMLETIAKIVQTDINDCRPKERGEQGWGVVPAYHARDMPNTTCLIFAWKLNS